MVRRFFCMVIVLVMIFGFSTAQADLFSDIGSWATQTWEEATGWVSQAAEDTADWVSQAADDTAGWVSQAAQDTAHAAENVWNWTSQTAQDAAGAVKEKFRNTADWASRKYSDLYDLFSGTQWVSDFFNRLDRLESVLTGDGSQNGTLKKYGVRIVIRLIRLIIFRY